VTCKASGQWIVNETRILADAVIENAADYSPEEIRRVPAVRGLLAAPDTRSYRPGQPATAAPHRPARSWALPQAA
jgi:hypothetical protein